LFERFLSKERDEPPDIDIDFEHERREEIIQYIYEKYGRHRTGLAATVITYRWRSAMRDVSKALGLDTLQVERLILALRRRTDADEKNLARWLREAGFDPNSTVIKHLLTLVHSLIGFPRHLSQHVGGFVIAADSLESLVPIENASMPERTVIQWDKNDLESLGLLKVDVLSLGMLTAIRRALEFYNNRHGTQLTMTSIPAEDPEVYAMIQKADTIGVFQIESRAQMSMLPRLRPKTFYDLVVEIAIVRPGPIQGDMVHPYLRRRDGLEKIDYPSPEVEAVLSRTLGVPIFQEQVMQLSVVAAGFTPGEADQLRRAMATWKKTGKLEQFRSRLCDGMLARGYTQEFAERIFKQIEGFGEYGFPESHSASFAILAYSSAWLKCFAPAEFTAALLNSQPMGFYQPAQLVRDARDHGVVVRPVDVLCSEWLSTLEYIAAPDDSKPSLRLGLHMVAGFSEQAALRLVQARQARTFVDAQDLALRAKLNSSDLEALAAADALHNLAGNRHQAAWTLAGVDTQLSLFAELPLAEATPLLPVPTEGQNILADYHSLGLSLRRHPLALLRDRCLRRQIMSATQLQQIKHDTQIRTAGLVLARQSPQTAKDTTFITLEDETGQINLIVWSNVAQRYRQPFLSAYLLEVAGRVQHQSGVMHVVVESMIDRSNWIGDLQIRARDFH
jgi:error-prone DNA polymerase